MTPTLASVQIQGLKKSFGDHEVLKGIDIEIPQGHLVCFIGRSGCGKSTMLRCLNGLEILDEGKISMGPLHLERNGAPFSHKEFEQTARQIRKYAGMVFQHFQLFPHLNLLDNVSLAPQVLGYQSKENSIATAEKYLELVGLSSHKHKFPSQLSGGQQQRGAIARALTLEPKIMLYDEPTSALDPELVGEVLQVMKTLDREADLTQLVVTHEMRFAREASDTVVFIEDGVIVEAGPPDQIFGHPNDERTRRYIGKFL
ncbi:MAG: amino acid ABC transporter ATP-binding protein [Proteobacteria bacterium]|jgi:ABC-type polar amino acid transport system ATPase subunit|nr:amino acid ABC transporter ATP-binding protein [Pseudomonadota bacterium]